MSGLAEPATTQPSQGLSRNESSHNNKNNHRMVSPNAATASGWDCPPAVASPVSLDDSDENYGTWIPRPCHWKTPQRFLTLDPSSQPKSSNTDPRRQDEKQPQPPRQPGDFTWGNLVCAPIVVSKTYILVASDRNLFVYGNFDIQKDPLDNEEWMQTRIDTTAIPPLTKFSLSSDSSTSTHGFFDFGDKIIQMSFHEETSIVYVLTTESCIYQVKLILDDSVTNRKSSTTDATAKPDSGTPPTSTPTNTLQPPRFQLLHNWVTKKLGATCMATLSDGGGTGMDMVCVGYKSGHIEAWKVPQVAPSPDPKHKTQPYRSRNPRKKDEPGVSLEWQGFLYDSIRTLSFLSRGSNELPATQNTSGMDAFGNNGKGIPSDDDDKTTRKTESPTKDRTEPIGKVEEHYLMTIVSSNTRIGDKGKQQPTSSMVKILDLKRIANEMSNKKDPSDAGTGDCLEKYASPESRGMELLEATTVSLSKTGRLPKRVPILNSHGANAACRLTSTGSLGQESASLTGINFPDGVVGLFSSSRETFDAVGIARSNHQVLLSYPAIGNGQIDIMDGNGNTSSYLVACLRGGTCYLIPIASEDNTSNNSIATVPFPHDIESDLSDIYVQAFTAGNLIVDEVDLPVLVFAWPGGVIDVYVCGLMDSKTTPNGDGSEIAVNDPKDVLISRAERRCLEDLIDNESISLISKIVLELRENSRNSLLETDEWNQLLGEIKAGTKQPPSEETITLESLCSMEHQSLRRLLLSLALVKD